MDPASRSVTGLDRRWILITEGAVYSFFFIENIAVVQFGCKNRQDTRKRVFNRGTTFLIEGTVKRKKTVSGSAVPLFVLSGRHSRRLFEQGTEIGEMVHAAAESHVSDGNVRVVQKLLGNGHPDMQDAFAGRLSRDSFQLPVEMGPGHA